MPVNTVTEFPSRTIPTVIGEPYYTMRTRLDGRDFNLRFAWNQTAERWHMDIYSGADEPLALGIKIVCGIPLLRFYQYDARLPPGILMAMDLSNDNSPPGFLDLAIGKRVELTYFPTTNR